LERQYQQDDERDRQRLDQARNSVAVLRQCHISGCGWR
jgi:hypothetical protein